MPSAPRAAAIFINDLPIERSIPKPKDGSSTLPGATIPSQCGAPAQLQRIGSGHVRCVTSRGDIRIARSPLTVYYFFKVAFFAAGCLAEKIPAVHPCVCSDPRNTL